MSNFEREILSLLKRKFGEVRRSNGESLASLFQKSYEFYFHNPADNLYTPMTSETQKQYGNGSGSELVDKVYPAKMKALRSSSAMTYNLFRNDPVVLKGNDRIGRGTYECTYEKQVPTLRGPGMPANFDAFLYCPDTGEAVVCEMKLAEWLLDKPATLSQAYTSHERYPSYEDKVAAEIFIILSRKLFVKNIIGSKNRYDVAQMFKHTLACYNVCQHLKGIHKLTLVNCVWELPEHEVLSASARETYDRLLQEEHEQFDAFRKVMAPVHKLFQRIGVSFEYQYYSVAQLVELMELPAEVRTYLGRYL